MIELIYVCRTSQQQRSHFSTHLLVSGSTNNICEPLVVLPT